jgi:mercuric ion transport protein
MMHSNKGKRLITIGVIGAIIAVVCCFTPALVILLSGLGLAAVTGYLDYALFAAIGIFLGLIGYGWWIKSRSATGSQASDDVL